MSAPELSEQSPSATIGIHLNDGIASGRDAARLSWLTACRTRQLVDDTSPHACRQQWHIGMTLLTVPNRCAILRLVFYLLQHDCIQENKH
jgi:hypothetical protein